MLHVTCCMFVLLLVLPPLAQDAWTALTPKLMSTVTAEAGTPVAFGLPGVERSRVRNDMLLWVHMSNGIFMRTRQKHRHATFV